MHYLSCPGTLLRLLLFPSLPSPIPSIPSLFEGVLHLLFGLGLVMAVECRYVYGHSQIVAELHRVTILHIPTVRTSIWFMIVVQHLMHTVLFTSTTRLTFASFLLISLSISLFRTSSILVPNPGSWFVLWQHSAAAGIYCCYLLPSLSTSLSVHRHDYVSVIEVIQTSPWVGLSNGKSIARTIHVPACVCRCAHAARCLHSTCASFSAIRFVSIFTCYYYLCVAMSRLVVELVC